MRRIIYKAIDLTACFVSLIISYNMLIIYRTSSGKFTGSMGTPQRGSLEIIAGKLDYSKVGLGRERTC